MTLEPKRPSLGPQHDSYGRFPLVWLSPVIYCSDGVNASFEGFIVGDKRSGWKFKRPAGCVHSHQRCTGCQGSKTVRDRLRLLRKDQLKQ